MGESIDQGKNCTKKKTNQKKPRKLKEMNNKKSHSKTNQMRKNKVCIFNIYLLIMCPFTFLTFQITFSIILSVLLNAKTVQTEWSPF